MSSPAKSGSTLRRVTTRDLLSHFLRAGPNEQTHLLFSYRLCMSTTELLDSLFARYEDCERRADAEGCRRVVQWLERWASLCYQSDFRSRPKVVERVVLWMSTHLTDGNAALKMQFVRREEGSSIAPPSSMDVELPVSSVLPSTVSFKFLDWRTSRIAEHLAAISANLYNKILPNELAEYATAQLQAINVSNNNAATTSNNNNSSSATSSASVSSGAGNVNVLFSFSAIDAPNLAAVCQRFSALSFWVASSVVMQPESVTARSVSTVLRKWLSVAWKLLKLRDFQSLLAILHGLHHGAVQRLKAVWMSLPPKMIERFQALDLLYSTGEGRRHYRDALGKAATTSPAVVPFVNAVLEDLLALNSGDVVSAGLVNVAKLEAIGQSVYDALRYQPVNYNFQLDNSMIMFLRSLNVALKEDNLYSESMKKEPMRMPGVAKLSTEPDLNAVARKRTPPPGASQSSSSLISSSSSSLGGSSASATGSSPPVDYRQKLSPRSLLAPTPLSPTSAGSVASFQLSSSPTVPPGSPSATGSGGDASAGVGTGKKGSGIKKILGKVRSRRGSVSGSPDRGAGGRRSSVMMHSPISASPEKSPVSRTIGRGTSRLSFSRGQTADAAMMQHQQAQLQNILAAKHAASSSHLLSHFGLSSPSAVAPGRGRTPFPLPPPSEMEPLPRIMPHITPESVDDARRKLVSLSLKPQRKVWLLPVSRHTKLHRRASWPLVNDSQSRFVFDPVERAMRRLELVPQTVVSSPMLFVSSDDRPVMGPHLLVAPVLVKKTGPLKPIGSSSSVGGHLSRGSKGKEEADEGEDDDSIGRGARLDDRLDDEEEEEDTTDTTTTTTSVEDDASTEVGNDSQSPESRTPVGTPKAGRLLLQTVLSRKSSNSNLAQTEEVLTSRVTSDQQARSSDLVAQKHPLSWTEDDVSVWLAGLGLENYVASFAENCVGGQELLDLVEEDLADLKMTKIGHKRTLLAAVQQLRMSVFPATPRAAAPLSAVGAAVASNPSPVLSHHNSPSLTPLSRSVAMSPRNVPSPRNVLSPRSILSPRVGSSGGVLVKVKCNGRVSVVEVPRDLSLAAFIKACSDSFKCKISSIRCVDADGEVLPIKTDKDVAFMINARESNLNISVFAVP